MKRKIIPKQKYTTYATFPLVSGDVRAYELELDLGENVTGAEFKVTAFRADGKVIEDIGQVTDGVARYTMANNMYSVPGELTVRLAVVHNSSVLTDREIIFQVLSGASETNAAQSSVTINDSVILKLSDIENTVSNKVDKVSGMGLSSNDFTNEYKEKLDGLDETIGEELESISEALDNLSDSFDSHKSESNPHKVTASQVGAYSKTETNTLLNEKADKSDISNVYKFKGSVETFDDLPTKYKIIPKGNPTLDGVEIGTYDAEKGIVTLSEEFENERGYITDLYQIFVEVEEIKLSPGYYSFNEYVCINGLGEGYPISYFITNGVWKTDEELVINGIYIGRGDVVRAGYYFLGDIKKFPKNYVEKLAEPDDEGVEYIYTKDIILENGNVYNTLDTDMNYAWTGEKWDSLGGEHEDVEAREDIEALEGQMGDVETALDSIIEIQNSLMGGETE